MDVEFLIWELTFALSDVDFINFPFGFPAKQIVKSTIYAFNFGFLEEYSTWILYLYSEMNFQRKTWKNGDFSKEEKF